MSKKRGNGEGTISRRKDGKWCAAITNGINPETGKPKRIFFYGKTRQEVAEKLNSSLHHISQGTFADPSKVKVSEWLNTWLFEYKKNDVRPSTFESYEYLIRVHINPDIGHILIKDLKPEHLQKLYNQKKASGRADGKGGLSAKTINRIHVVIHAALDQAVKNNLIIRNVSEATTLPKQIKKEMTFLNVEEQLKFLNALTNDRLRAAFILALGTGMRRGEILALKWKNVNLKDSTIKIKESVSRVKVFDNDKNMKTQIIFQDPKTNSSKRTIPLPGNVTIKLKEHKKRQNEEILKAGHLYEDNDLVFCSEVGKLLDPAGFLKKFYSLIKKAELRHVNFHALRHTYATRLLEVNEHPKVVQELLGHSDISLTLNTYSHVIPDIKIAAAQKINFLFDNENFLLNENIKT